MNVYLNTPDPRGACLFHTQQTGFTINCDIKYRMGREAEEEA